MSLRVTTTGAKEALMNRIQCMRDVNGVYDDQVDELIALRAGCCAVSSSSSSLSTSSSSSGEENQCNEQVVAGAEGYQEYVIQLGTETGTVYLNYDALSVPDRFVVEYDGVEVIDTGYRGADSFNDQLADLGLPPVEGPGEGSAGFNKLSPTPTIAIVKIYAPLEGTAWQFTLTCPDPDAELNNVEFGDGSVVEFSNENDVEWSD